MPHTLKSQTPGPHLIAPEDEHVAYSDYVHMEFVPSPVNPSAKVARFDRVFDIPGKGYRWDNPGARIRFRTDATSVKALLYFNELHISVSARNSNGLFLVDGAHKPEWTYHTKATQTKRAPESVEVKMADGGAAGFHDYELILPYGDSVDFQGVVTSVKADVISVLMGANDWQGGGPLARYRSNMMGFFDAIRKAQPNVPIYYLTSLWVPPSWNPKAQVADLEAYRQVAREIVTARKDANLHLVEGVDLIDHDAALFDATPVHPNDKGFAQMGERLAAQMHQPVK